MTQTLLKQSANIFRIPFDTMKENYPNPKDHTRGQLFEEIGWGRLASDPGYANTCAIRMSYGLIKSEIPIESDMSINKGPHSGKQIEISQVRLTNYLLKKAFNQLGTPELLCPHDRDGRALVRRQKAKEQFIKQQRQGVISYMDLYKTKWGAWSGHIDLIWVRHEFPTFPGGTHKVKIPGTKLQDFGNHASDYWDRSRRIYFWELP